MKGGANNLPGSPIRIIYTPDSIVEEIVNLIPESNKKNIEIIGKNRNLANPNNRIIIDKKNNIVYKVGLYLHLDNKRGRGIDNEYLAYTKLNEKYGQNDLIINWDGINIRRPKLFDCYRYNDSKYGLLIIEYIPEIKILKPIPINIKTKINSFLQNASINHNDLDNNVFIDTEGNIVIIDFDAAIEFKNKNEPNYKQKGPGLFGFDNNNI